MGPRFLGLADDFVARSRPWSAAPYHRRGTDSRLPDADAAKKSATFLFDEIGPRLAKGPIRLGVFVQIAERGDNVADASVADNQSALP